MDRVNNLPFPRNEHVVDYLQQRELNSKLVSGWNPFVNHGISNCKHFYRKNLVAHFGCVNAIEFSHDGKWLVSGGDDRRILLWNVHKAIHGNRHIPLSMQAEHASNIFAIACDRSNTKIYSGGNDDQVIVHDIQTRAPLDCFQHDQPVFGISVDPLNDYIFASACDSGKVSIYDIRDSNADPFCLASSTSAFHAVMFNPVEPRLVVTANSKKGVALFDVRYPKRCLLKYGGNHSDLCCMSAKFSSDGKRIFALRRRLPPVLYSTDSTNHLYQFNHNGYYNSCTMKSCSFAGENDEYVLSGSDNFDLYLWKIPSADTPEDSHKKFVQDAHLVLKGHRSIVNQVRYNPTYSIIASSGVEKLIKLFSPFPLPSTQQGRSFWELPNEKERRIYTHDDYINLVMESGQFSSLTFDTSRRNTKEDPRMMAFFDALVQRDIEGMDEADNDSRQRVSYTNTAFSFSSIFSDESPPLVETSGDSDGPEEYVMSSRLVSARHGSIQVVQSPMLISDESSDEASNVPVNIVRESANNIENNSIELELVPNEAVNDDSDEPLSQGERNLTTNRLNSADDSDENNENVPDNPQNDEENASNPEEEVQKNVRGPRENLITQMISKRQEKLLQMANAHTRLEVQSKEEQLKQQRENKLLRKRAPAPVPSKPDPPPSSSLSSSSISSSSDSDSSDSDSKQLSKLKKQIKPLLWRNKKKVLATTSTDSDDDNVPVINPKRKRVVKNKTAVSNKKYGASEETLTKLKLYLSSLKDAASSKQTPVAPTPIENNRRPLGNNEPCTSASALLRDAIAAGLSQSNVIYDENNSDGSSSLSSTSTSSSSSDSELERLVANEIKSNRKFRKGSKHGQNTNSDSNDSSESDKRKEASNKPLNKNNESFSQSRYAVSHRVPETGRKRGLASTPKTDSLDMNSSPNDSDSGNEHIAKMLPIAKSHLVKGIKTNKRRKTEDSSDIDVESSVKRKSNNANSSLSFATPDSGIESSRNGHINKPTDSSSSVCSNNSNNGSINDSQLEMELPNADDDKHDETPDLGVDGTSFKKHDEKTKRRHYRNHEQNGE